MHQQPHVIREELSYDQASLRSVVDDDLPCLDEAQRQIFAAVTNAMAAPAPEVWLCCLSQSYKKGRSRESCTCMCHSLFLSVSEHFRIAEIFLDWLADISKSEHFSASVLLHFATRHASLRKSHSVQIWVQMARFLRGLS